MRPGATNDETHDGPKGRWKSKLVGAVDELWILSVMASDWIDDAI